VVPLVVLVVAVELPIQDQMAQVVQEHRVRDFLEVLL
jgi:hypothetical protein